TAPANRDGNRSNYMAWALMRLPGDQDHWSVYAKEAYYTGTGSRLRRFTYRPDGLVALTADDKGGEALTRPLAFEGAKLLVNYRRGDKGSMGVELADADERPIAGFRAADCEPLRGDKSSAAVAWKGDVALASLAGQPIRVRFILQDAELFSLRFE